MPEFDDEIKGLVQHLEEAVQKPHWSHVSDEEIAIRADKALKEGQRILELCDRFVVWANLNDIPSVRGQEVRFFGAGWLLGFRSSNRGMPNSDVYSPGGDDWYSILARPNGRIQEIKTSDSNKAVGSRQFRLAHELNSPHLYSAGSIVNSIAKIAHQNKKHWC